MEKLYTPYDLGDQPMGIAGFMSGSGSNLVKILEHQKKLEQSENGSPYQVRLIFSNNAKSNATEIGKRFNIPVYIRDIKGFYKEHDMPMSDMRVRQEYDCHTASVLKDHIIDVIALGGYMSFVTSPIHDDFLTINVHPANLRAENPIGERRYAGGNAVEKTLIASERELRSSVHIVDDKVDHGPILMVSEAVYVNPVLNPNIDPDILNALVDVYQEKLKQAGDWKIYPKTLELLATGRFSKNETGTLFLDDKPIPNGIEITELDNI